MPDRIVRLAILDTYGVRWSRETFARDLLQNFFDATPDFRSIALDIKPEARTVSIRGPVTFDADLLAYIGATTKISGKTVGGFGEGFKICALVGTRDFGLTITAGTGQEQLSVFLDPVPLGRELCYRVTHQDKAFEGSFVHLEGCDAECLAAFQAAPSMFRHPDNPKLNKVLVEDESQGIAVYLSPDPHRGELYYRRQLRGTASFWSATRSSALTLVHDPVIDALEGDRDRRDLPARPLAIEIGNKLDPTALYQVIVTLMPYWRYGCDVLSGFLDAGIERKLTYEWPRGWLARTDKGKGLDEFAERQGFKLAMHAFAKLGMKTPDQHYGNLETRPANPLERAQIQVISDLYADLTGTPAKIKDFEVFGVKGAAVLGQHLGDKVIVGAEVLQAGLDAAAPTILHELAHEKGGEESKHFLRQLTALLSATIRNPERIRAARRAYQDAKPPPPEPEQSSSDANDKKDVSEDASPQRYAPERDWGDYTVDGVVCVLVVPPAFPPTEELLNELAAACEEVSIPVVPITYTVTGPCSAVRALAPGIPTFWIGNIDPEPPNEPAVLGYHVRTYGEDSRRLMPSREAMARALVRAKEAGFTRDRKGYWAERKIFEQGEAKAIELGLAPKPRTVPKKEEAAHKKEQELEGKLRKLCGYSGYDLFDAWNAGKYAACKKILKRYVRDARPADAIWTEVRAKLDKAMNCSRVLRRADGDFDDADKLERDAMAAAQGAAVVAYVQEKDDDNAKALAERHFAAVRAITTRTFDLEVALDLKPILLSHTLEHAGLDEDNPKGLDLKKLTAEFERAVGIACAYQRQCDETVGYTRRYEFEKLLEKTKKEKISLKEILEKRERERNEAKAIEKSWAMKAFYEEQLEKTGDPVVAARRFLEEAAKVWPEKTS